MKFRLLSDLHLEFNPQADAPKPGYTNFLIEPQADDKETVLILAGDIDLGGDAIDFILQCCEQFRYVAYVLGNHEFYNHIYDEVRQEWRDFVTPDNFILLDDDVAYIDHVRIMGGTLWTDFDNDDWFAKQKAKDGMNDFDVIRKIDYNPKYHGMNRKFHPNDTVVAHIDTREFMRIQLAKPWDGPTVVVTHHLPHPLCVPEHFRRHPLNPAYVTNLDEFIAEHDIAVWCHGHTHDNVDFEIHGTRILCNPRGYYPNKLNEGFINGFVFEL
jgi:hypothetical protein